MNVGRTLRRVALLAVSGLALLLCSRASAQSRAGDFEAGAHLGVLQPVSGDDLEYELLRLLGYFIAQPWQVAVGLGIGGAFDENPNSLVQGQVNYHHVVGRSVLFAGPHVGVRAKLLQSSPDVAATAGAQGGVKFFVTETFSVNVEVKYSAAMNRFDEGGAGVLVGISWLRRMGEESDQSSVISDQ